MTESFSPKDPDEIVPVTFDFERLGITPTNPVISLSRYSGPKGAGDLSSMLSGSPQVAGVEVVQKIQGGVAGTVYKVRCQVDSGTGLRYVLAGMLAVETA